MSELQPWQEYDVSHYEDSLKPLFEAFVVRIRSLLEELLSKQPFSIFSITSRVKDGSSLRGKLLRKGYERPLADVKDFCGLRIVVHYSDEVNQVVDFLRSQFAVDDGHSGDKLTELGVGEFGYRTYNLVASLDDDRKNLPEWNRFIGMPFEIQIRSALQHAWATSSHSLDYKNSKDLPDEYRRKLFRLGALLEHADEEFISIRNKAKDISESHKAEFARGDYDAVINYFSLKEYLFDKVDIMELAAIGERLDLGYVAQSHAAMEDSLERLLELARVLSLNSLSDIDSVLPAIMDNKNLWLERFAAAYHDDVQHNKDYGTGFSGVDFFSTLLSIAHRQRLKHVESLAHVFYDHAVKWIISVIGSLE